MKLLKFSNAEVKKIVNTIIAGKPWKYSLPSIDNKFTIELKNNPANNKIDVYTDGKYVDDYTYDLSEKDDAYAAVVNVLDYLSNLMNKYNKRHPAIVKEEFVLEKELNALNKVEAEFLKMLHKNDAYNKDWVEIERSEDRLAKAMYTKGVIEIIRPAIKDKSQNIETGMYVVLTNKGGLLAKGLLEATKYFSIASEVDGIVEGMSKGMLKAYGRKLADADVHYTCKSCETKIPKYRGSYPNKCPSCGDSIKLMKETDKDEAIWGGPFKRGEVVQVKLEDPDKFWNATLINYNVADGTYGASMEADGKIIQGIATKNIK